MVSSEDEGEIVPNDILDYEFEFATDDLVSFAKLPVEWNKGNTDDRKSRQIFLTGKIDNGLRKICEPVIAWKFDISRQKQKPVISVLSANGYWIKLLKPRSRFREVIRAIQISLNFLHFCKWNPQGSQSELWDRLDNDFRMLERRPSEDDLRSHLALIKEAAQRDETLANSKVLTIFLEEKLRKRKACNEDVSSAFIVDYAEDRKKPARMDGPRVAKCDEDEVDDSSSDDFWDSACAICDNGGRILISGIRPPLQYPTSPVSYHKVSGSRTSCDGKCKRSFHPTKKDGRESSCESLGFTEEEFEAMKSVEFYCKNCEYEKHQCFSCGELGSSNVSSGAEVFCCSNEACGYFYHPLCVAKLLHPWNDASEEYAKRIASGEQFECPAHTCHVCKEFEVKKDLELGFAVCRRCPRAYHRKCLPREIASEHNVSEEKSGKLVQRAWEGLIPHRKLIYCLDHKIDPEICTPARDHIKFPGPQPKKSRKLSFESISNREILKERVVTFEDNAGKGILSKQPSRSGKVYNSKQGDLFRREVEKYSVQGSLRKQKLDATVSTPEISSIFTTDDDGEMSLGNRLYATDYSMEAELSTSAMGKSAPGENEITQKANSPTAKSIDNLDTPDNETRSRICKLMKEASSPITLDQVKKSLRAPSTHAQCCSSDNRTIGMVEGTVQALRAALKKLEEGGSIQDAKAFCDDDLVVQALTWREKLRVYLAPFQYGMRYTPFVTKVDKLKEIVDILHWYVQDNDTLVDFCCDSNDFSCLMKKKLDEMGKRTSFKNYDIMQPKNDFNFERRNWMEVRSDELPSGSQLIIGLNPPVGVNASRANNFMNKALEFMPKLIILIVPRETQRLDKKESPYDLIWEDDQMFIGKSFYLPQHVDETDDQMEYWDGNAPVLSLWSRPDFTSNHKAIAEQHGHLSGDHKKNIIDGNV